MDSVSTYIFVVLVCALVSGVSTLIACGVCHKQAEKHAEEEFGVRCEICKKQLKNEQD